jgi:exodeoxyribonuclease III
VRIISWNINSVRLRAPLVLKVLEELKPDIVCLQETKCPNEQFPLKIFESAGYTHAHISGMKGYNGVCILSKTPFTAAHIWDRVAKNDCRHIEVEMTVKGFTKPLRIHNLYIPAGGDIPDPILNDKFAHKLGFVDDVADFFAKNYNPQDPMIVLGDFNIAPLEHDVWSHKQLLDVVSHTPIEVEKLGNMQKSLEWVDALRHFVPHSQKLYTWWSYRNRDWRASNRGRRLDHIWVTPVLESKLKNHLILSEARDWVQPSDHVPVMIELAL